MRVNDFVIVADPNPVYGNWNVGRIIQLFFGENSQVRNFQVKIAAGPYTHARSPRSPLFILLKVLLSTVRFPHCGGMFGLHTRDTG